MCSEKGCAKAKYKISVMGETYRMSNQNNGKVSVVISSKGKLAKEKKNICHVTVPMGQAIVFVLKGRF